MAIAASIEFCPGEATNGMNFVSLAISSVDTFPPSSNPGWKIDAPAELVLVSENVVVAKDVHTRVVADERAEGAGHHYLVVWILETDRRAGTSRTQSSARVRRRLRQNDAGCRLRVDDADLFDIDWQPVVCRRQQVAWRDLVSWQLSFDEDLDSAMPTGRPRTTFSPIPTP